MSFSRRIGLSGWIAVLAGIFASAVLVQYVEVLLCIDSASEHVLPVPTVWILLVLLGANALGATLLRRELLSRVQMICLTWGMLMAAPMMTQGFWHRYLGTVTSLPRDGQFWLIDALPDKLWPHGDNLITDAQEPRTVDAAHPFDLRPRDVEPGLPYMLSALVQADDLPTGSVLTCTLLGDGGDPVEAWRLDRPTKPDVVRGDGYQRVGIYGLRAPATTQGHTLRFAFVGGGSAEVLDARMISVAAVELALSGRRVLTAEQAAALPPEQRAGAVVTPPTLASPDGLAFVASGGIPWSEWVVCMSAWGSFLVLLMGAVSAITLLLRRQWMEAERLPLPVARSLGQILGLEGTPLWRNRWFWGGLGLALVWCQLRYWHLHNQAVPDPTIAVPLKAYISDPSWGRMWEVTFTVHALFLGIALFFELNLLASMFVGFWLYRTMMWIGMATGTATADVNFPWKSELQVGAYLGYFTAIIALARRHLLTVAKQAVTGGWRIPAGDIVAPRTALLLLTVCLLGAMAWCSWVGLDPGGFALFMGFLLVIGVVAARLRAECGLLFGYFTPYNAALVFGGLGGMAVFGPQIVLFAFLASFWLAATTFHIPGAQIEFVEAGRREGLRARLLVGLPFVAVAAGMLFAGWAFLTLSYGQGGDNMRYGWAYESKIWYFQGFSQEVNAVGSGKSGSSFSSLGIAIGAAATGLVAVLRQFLPAFWLHPAGIVLGPSQMMEGVWGSILVALVLRALTVRMAGAEAVRLRLQPCGIGIFMAGVLTYLIACLHGTLLLGGLGFTELFKPGVVP